MIIFSPLTQIVTAQTKRLFKPISTVIAAGVLSLSLVAGSQAGPITGDPQPANPFGWAPNSTNALNYAQQTPGRIGQVAPYVLFNSNAVGSVTLDFFNFAAGGAFFETRIDDVITGGNSHPAVIGDTVKSGTFLTSGNSLLGKEFSANNYVDIRLALGGERDWDFDWVRFEVLPSNAVPLPGTLALFSLGMFGLAIFRRRSRS